MRATLRGTFFGWFEDHAIPKSQRIGDGPVGDHGREIERHDGGYDPQRDAIGTAFDSFADFEDFAADELGQGGGEFGKLYAFLHFGHRFAAGLAVLFADEGRKFIEMLFQQVFIAEENLHPLFYRCLAPAGEGVFGSGDGGVEFGRSGAGHLRQWAAVEGGKQQGGSGQLCW